MEETSLGGFDLVKAILGGTAAGFVFAEAASFALEPVLTEDPVLLRIAVLSAGRAGSTGIGVVSACLVCTSLLISLGSGFLLAALVMKLLSSVGASIPWLTEVATAVSLVFGASITGVLGGFLPEWMYITVQMILVVAVYFYSNINQMTQALLIIFTTLYVSVYFGRMGVIFGMLLTGLAIAFLCALRKALRERITPTPKSQTECKLLERIFFYCVVVGILGFGVGLGAGEAKENSDAQVEIMLESVLWVAFLSAGLLGAGLGTVAMVGGGAEVAGKIALGTSIISAIALRVILHNMSVLGARSSTGGMLGVTTAAGVSLGAASVAAKNMYKSRNSFLATLASVIVGVIVSTKVFKSTLTATSELTTLSLVAVGAYVLGAPRSPFNTEMNLRQGLLTGPELIKGIGMETITAAAAPIGAGVLGAAAIGTAALGRLGTAGVVVAITLALGSSLIGMIGQSLPSPAKTEHTD